MANQPLYRKDVLSGFVELLDMMPHPLTGISVDSYIVQCARTSYLGASKGYDADMKLLKYLIDNKHFTPMEHVKMSFRVRTDLATARQWMRYRTGTFSEVSRRYTEVDGEDFYYPGVWRTQSKNNKQGSGDNLGVAENGDAIIEYRYAIDNAYASYQQLLELGVAREQARLVLPMSTMTTFIWTTDLRNLIFGFIRERVHHHAQAEIREYANAALEIVREIAPKTVEFSSLFNKDGE
jgi:thymidylate synthase (FAD)